MQKLYLEHFGNIYSNSVLFVYYIFEKKNDMKWLKKMEQFWVTQLSRELLVQETTKAKLSVIQRLY